MFTTKLRFRVPARVEGKTYTINLACCRPLTQPELDILHVPLLGTVISANNNLPNIVQKLVGVSTTSSLGACLLMGFKMTHSIDPLADWKSTADIDTNLIIEEPQKELSLIREGLIRLALRYEVIE